MNDLPRRELVLSGIRATGRLHLGNYLGALRRFVEFSQDTSYECLYFVADLHTLTTAKDAANLREHLPEIVTDYLAAGIDPSTSVIYAQSSVPRIASLMWYLSCVSPMGNLNRMKTFEEKAEKHPDDVNAGLFTYPVLMAADILGPRAELVPVGKDQESHLEFAGLLARRLNNLFGDDYFPIPNPLRHEMVTVPGLAAMSERGDFPKMGKSDDNTINLSDSPETVWAKVRPAPTDPARIRRQDPGTPEKCVIYALHTHVSPVDEMRDCADGCRTARIGCIECKKRLTKNINRLLEPFQEQRQTIARQPDLVQDVLADGAQRAQNIINPTVDYVEEQMGIVRFDRD